MSDKKQRTLTVSQKTVEDWINSSEESGQFLNALGLISDEELAAGIHKEEELRVKIEADPEMAEAIVRQNEQTGEDGEETVERAANNVSG